MTDSLKKDFNPKHRVVGAIVLVALAVIVLPLILDSGEDGWHADGGGAVAPAVENQVFVADVTQAGTTKDATPTAKAAPALPATPPTTAIRAPSTRPSPKASTVAPAPLPPLKIAPARAVAAPADKGFYVQVGTFGNQANARQLADKLKQHGYRVRLEQIHLASGDALRVRVGPYAQSTQAQTARAAIQRNLDVQGIVRAY